MWNLHSKYELRNAAAPHTVITMEISVVTSVIFFTSSRDMAADNERGQVPLSDPLSEVLRKPT